MGLFDICQNGYIAKTQALSTLPLASSTGFGRYHLAQLRLLEGVVDLLLGALD